MTCGTVGVKGFGRGKRKLADRTGVGDRNLGFVLLCSQIP